LKMNRSVRNSTFIMVVREAVCGKTRFLTNTNV
jgi:hypothetical protein